MRRFIAALAVLSLVSTTTFGAVGKVYPGAMGVRWSSVDPFPSLASSMIQNPSSTRWLRLDMPAVHDTTRKITRAWVKVVDRHYDDDVRCSLHSVYRSGGSFYGFASPTRYSNGSSTGPQTLTFGALGANSFCHYYFSCHIPRTYGGNRSGIISYYVEEQ